MTPIGALRAAPELAVHVRLHAQRPVYQRHVAPTSMPPFNPPPPQIEHKWLPEAYVSIVRKPRI
jgi:hypothetical protein